MKAKTRRSSKKEPVESPRIDVVLWRDLRAKGRYSDAQIAAKMGIDLKTLKLLDDSMAQDSLRW